MRALVHSLVLIVAIGPSTATLCRVVCDRHSGTVACIHEHQHAAARISSGDECADAGISFTAFIREDARRGAPASHEDVLIAAARFPVPPLTASLTIAEQPWNGWSLDSRPLSTALRI